MMTKWEYKILEWTELRKLESEMNALGDKGWEVATVQSSLNTPYATTVVLKREKA